MPHDEQKTTVAEAFERDPLGNPPPCLHDRAAACLDGCECGKAGPCLRERQQETTVTPAPQPFGCAVIGGHDYRPAMGLWRAVRACGGDQRLPRWFCTRCGAERPPLTDRERMQNLWKFMTEEAAK